MKPWTSTDLRKVIDSALDAFAVEFYGVAEFRRLPRKDQLAIVRELKADSAVRHAYQWMMRTA